MFVVEFQLLPLPHDLVVSVAQLICPATPAPEPHPHPPNVLSGSHTLSLPGTQSLSLPGTHTLAMPEPLCVQLETHCSIPLVQIETLGSILLDLLFAESVLKSKQQLHSFIHHAKYLLSI